MTKQCMEDIIVAVMVLVLVPVLVPVQGLLLVLVLVTGGTFSVQAGETTPGGR